MSVHRHPGLCVAAGFTLIEVVVAVAVFAVVAALAWGGLDRMLRAREVIDGQTLQWLSLQQAIGQIERDIRQAAPRPVRDGVGQTRPALMGGAVGIELSRFVGSGGWDRASPALERVAWRCEDDRLQRLRWPVLDRGGHSQAVVEDVLEGVGDCRWSFLAEGGRVDRWPPTADEDPGRLPRGLEFRFRIAGGGEYRRVLELPENAAMVGE